MMMGGKALGACFVLCLLGGGVLGGEWGIIRARDALGVRYI